MNDKLKNQLSSDEAKELSKCEALISIGFRTFYEVGNALIKISDDRLYRQTHSTFEQYCQDRWGISARKAYRLCEAAGVGKIIDAANVSNLTQTALPKPESESTARVLAHLEPDEVVAVWSEAVKDGKQPTTEEVEKIVDAKIPPRKEKQDRKPVKKPSDPLLEEAARQIANRKKMEAWYDQGVMLASIPEFKHAVNLAAQKILNLTKPKAEPENVLPMEKSA